MNLKAKRHVEEQKKKVQEKLAARVAMLKEKGIEPKQLSNDTQVRKLRADVRKANARLRSITASEAIGSLKIQKKQEKAEAEKLARESGEAKPAKKKADKGEKAAKKEKKVKDKEKK